MVRVMWAGTWPEIQLRPYSRYTAPSDNPLTSAMIRANGVEDNMIRYYSDLPVKEMPARRPNQDHIGMYT